MTRAGRTTLTSSTTTRHLRDERGSILVLTTLLLPAMVALGALALGGTTLWASHHDGQRAADLGALAGAANTPTASVTRDAATLPVPLDGRIVTRVVGDTLDPTDWRDRPCEVLFGQLEGERSPVLRSAAGTGNEPGCTAAWEHESLTLSAMAACAGDLLDVPGCSDDLRDTVAQTLPVVNASQPDVTNAMSKASAVASRLTNTSDRLLTAADAAALRAACLVRVPIIGCTMTLADKLLAEGDDRLAALGLSPDGVPKVGVDLDGLLPALMTPRVRVQLTGVELRPTLSPFTFPLASDATARRTIKSVIVLPSLGLPGYTAQATLDARLGGSSTQFAANAGVDGYIVDPNDVTRWAADVDPLGRTLDAVDAVDHVVSDHLVGSFTEVACARAFVSRHCPQFDGVVATDTIRNEFLQDIRDATAPPPPGAQPSLQELLESYSQTGEPVWTVAPLRRLKLDEVLAEAGIDVPLLRVLNPSLDSLLAGFAFIPAFDVMPAIVEQVDPTRPIYTLRRPPLNDLTATRGLFQARLVK